MNEDQGQDNGQDRGQDQGQDQGQGYTKGYMPGTPQHDSLRRNLDGVLMRMAADIMKVRRQIVGYHVTDMVDHIREAYLPYEERGAIQDRRARNLQAITKLMAGLPTMYQAYFEASVMGHGMQPMDVTLKNEAYGTLIKEGKWMMSHAVLASRLNDEPDYEWAEENVAALDAVEDEADEEAVIEWVDDHDR